MNLLKDFDQAIAKAKKETSGCLVTSAQASPRTPMPM